MMQMMIAGYLLAAAVGLLCWINAKPIFEKRGRESVRAAYLRSPALTISWLEGEASILPGQIEAEDYAD